MKIIREACVENQEQLDNAFNHHAEQIELCSRLDVGGFTPTSTLTKYALSKSDHVLMMVRNRPDFNANC
jgi:copper homeostasis protein CutC